jgi:cytochrome c peroxidase
MRWLRRLTLLGLAAAAGPLAAAEPQKPDPHEHLLPNNALRTPFKDEVPILFLSRNQNAAEWDRLPAFWNESAQDAVDPITGAKIARRAITIKVPLGLTAGPPVPAENPMTLAKWELGKRLYYDPILSSNAKVSCATCHDPGKGFTDQRQTSFGINDTLGPINAPTVINAAYNRLQFWDGRGMSLEDQSQGPVGNAKEMFGGGGDAWEAAVRRIRANPEYVTAFQKVFGHAPTRDAAAKAIATYERTVLSGNSIHDRAEVLMRKRVAEEETGKYELKAEDYAAAVKAAFQSKDANALAALGATEPAGADALGAKLALGRTLFFGKARCSNCHVGDTFTDHQFHNLGVGATDGALAPDDLGRYAQLPIGHKDPGQVGAYKTPGLRALLGTQPYMHSGDEKNLEAVIDFYDRGGNVNPFLDPKMRDVDAEAAYLKARAAGQPVDPKVKTYGDDKRPVIPFKLNLSADEKAALVLFLRALQGDPLDPIVADPKKYATK